MDRSLGRKLAAALRAAEVAAITHDSVFSDPATPDEEWLRRCGTERWIVITKDQMIRKRTLEREALLEAKVEAFVFTGGHLSGTEVAEVITRALPKMTQLLNATDPPFIARITGSGNVELIADHE